MRKLTHPGVLGVPERQKRRLNLGSDSLSSIGESPRQAVPRGGGGGVQKQARPPGHPRSTEASSSSRFQLPRRVQLKLLNA